MENRAYALAAGLFTLLLGSALVAAIVWIGGESIDNDAYVLYTRGDVSGLNVQAPVRFRGVEVGKVESISFDPDDSRIILVGISVRSGTPLTLSAFGQLAAQGVTGLSYVQLSDDHSRPQLRDPTDAVQARIELRPSFFDRLTQSGEQMVVRLASAAQHLDAWLTEENRQQFLRTLASVDAAAQMLGAVAQSVQPGAKLAPALVEQAGATLRHADATLVEVKKLMVALEGRVDAIDRIVASAERIGTAVQEASAAGTRLSVSADRQTIPKLNSLLEEVSRSSRSLERLIEDLSANPNSIVFGRSPLPPGPGEPGFAHGTAK